MHPDIRDTAAQDPTPQQQQQHFHARRGPDAAVLPDFSLDALLGGRLPENQALLTPSTQKASVHARRGSAAAGAGLFIKPLQKVCAVLHKVLYCPHAHT